MNQKKTKGKYNDLFEVKINSRTLEFPEEVEEYI